MSPLPCPDLHPALLQSIPALQPVETTVSKFINKEWASEASPTPCIVIIIMVILPNAIKVSKPTGQLKHTFTVAGTRASQ